MTTESPMLKATLGETVPASGVKETLMAGAATGVASQTPTGPGIPGDDIPLTSEEEAEFDALAVKLTSAPDAPRFTPPPVTDYRTLSRVEVDLMNMIKVHGNTLDEAVKIVQGHLLMQRRDAARLPSIVDSDAELTRIDKAEAARWAAIARTHFQEGLTALTRAVAQPTSF